MKLKTNEARLLIKFKLDKTSFPLSISSKESIISIPPNIERVIAITIEKAKPIIDTFILALDLTVFTKSIKSYLIEGLFLKLVGSSMLK